MTINTYNTEIFDGSEDDFSTFSYAFRQNGFDRMIKFDDFYPNHFRKLESVLSISERQQIISQLGIKYTDYESFVTYKDPRDLGVYYAHITSEDQTLYLMFSFGEFQPTRYRIFLLGTAQL